MNNAKRILLSSPHMSEEGYEKEYVQSAFDTNWIAPLGPNVDAFEEEVANYVGTSYAVALSSGTAAIHLALRAAGIQEGDIVFCQSLTFSASANPIIYENATPVFIDSEEESWNMDPDALREAFKKYPNAKAVIVVHLYGYSAKISEIKEICEKNNAVLVEDAAESLGTFYKGQHTGTFGDYGIISFNGNKIITTSGGGMLISNNGEKLQQVRKWATQSRENYPWYEHKELGFNYRLSNISAGIGRGQMKVLDQRVAKKREIFNYYRENLKDIPQIKFKKDLSGDEPNHWLSTIIITDITPEVLLKALNNNNIEGRHFWKPMHIQPFFSNYDFVGQGYSEYLFNHGVCLPSDTKMTDEELSQVVTTIRECFNGLN